MKLTEPSFLCDVFLAASHSSSQLLDSDMAEPIKVGDHPEKGLTVGHRSEDDPSTDNDSIVDAQKYAYSDDRKIGITGAVFLILNKMIGTGSKLASTARYCCSCILY